MNADEYQKALKTVQSNKPKDSYMVIEFDYSNKVIVHHKEGIALLTSLNTAEHFEESYSGVSRIEPFDRDKLKASIMSAEEYQQYKIAMLLNVRVQDVRDHEKQAA